MRKRKNWNWILMKKPNNREKEERKRERMKKYENSIRLLLEQLLKQGEMTLATLNEICNETERKQLIPNAENFPGNYD